MNLKIVDTKGDDQLARVFVAQLSDGNAIEFVESVQPPIPREQKWVLIVSTLKGCPVKCPICDAGGNYQGKLSAEEIFAQIDYLIYRRYPSGKIAIPKLKIQFARMGEPALNNAVLEVLSELPKRYQASGIMPCISTIAPTKCESFFEELLLIKKSFYSPGRFQMQFSLHTTCEDARSRLIPRPCWTNAQIAAYGVRFFSSGDRKVTLNFAPVKGFPLEPTQIATYFSPDIFMVKLTPINPTFAAQRSRFESVIDPELMPQCYDIADKFKKIGYETVLSIGELEENQIGSNCGMCVQSMQEQAKSYPQRQLC